MLLDGNSNIWLEVCLSFQVSELSMAHVVEEEEEVVICTSACTFYCFTLYKESKALSLLLILSLLI